MKGVLCGMEASSTARFRTPQCHRKMNGNGWKIGPCGSQTQPQFCLSGHVLKMFWVSIPLWLLLCLGFAAIPADVGSQRHKSTIKSDREKINSQPMSQRDMEIFKANVLPKPFQNLSLPTRAVQIMAWTWYSWSGAGPGSQKTWAIWASLRCLHCEMWQLRLLMHTMPLPSLIKF